MNVKKVGFYCLLAVLFVISACGTEGQEATTANEQQETVNGQELEAADFLKALEMSVDIQQKDETIVFDVLLTNQSSENVNITFPSSQQLEMKVTNENGEHIYTYSMDKSFVQAIEDVSILAGETHSWHEEWEIGDNVTSGTYEVVVEIVTSHINGEEITENPLQVTKRFQINVGSEAFRNIEVSGEHGQYVVKGDARVFEGVFYYTVEEGHEYLIEETQVAVPTGAPAWEPFELAISIPEEQLPSNGTLTLDLYEKSAKDHAASNQYFVKLDEFGY